MKILNCQFINVVSHGGQIKSASSTSPSNPDRVGSSPCEIELDPESMTFAITRFIGSVKKTKFVHVSNVSGWEIDPTPEVKPQAQVKK